VSINRKKFGALLGVIAICIAVASTAGAAGTHTTACSIKIGGTFPLSEGPATGGASLYKTITYAEQAYFGYINSTTGVGKDHCTINDVVLDDQYTPSETVTDVKTLVESDHVSAIVGSLGTAPGLATMAYLNTHKIPQVLLATGDAYWGLCSLKAPAFKKQKGVCNTPKTWTEGWQPDYPGESKMYAKYVLNHVSNPKIGVLYQNDAYGQNYLAGFQAGLGSHKGDIVHTEAYTAGETGPQIGARVGAIAAHGANVFVIFATPGASISALVTETAISYNPLTILNNVSANPVFLYAAEQNGANVNGVLSTTYVKSQLATPNDAAMQLGKAIIYGTGNAGLKHQWDIGDANLVYGLAVAYTFVDALNHSPNFLAAPTTAKGRLALMTALRSLNENGAKANPFVYPGMAVKTSAGRTFPMQQLELEHWQGQTNSSLGGWATFGSVVTSGH
jgi:branched-chain amino acid transport system substrate-binding protein